MALTASYSHMINSAHNPHLSALSSAFGLAPAQDTSASMTARDVMGATNNNSSMLSNPFNALQTAAMMQSLYSNLSQPPASVTSHDVTSVAANGGAVAPHNVMLSSGSGSSGYSAFKQEPLPKRELSPSVNGNH